jgi:metal-sulfur cluster biosynthetic enzyme
VNTDSLRECVEKALSEITDPETGLNIMRMNLIRDLVVADDGRVGLTFRPSSPVCPMAYSLANSIRTKLKSVPRVSRLSIHVENFHQSAHLEGLLNRDPSTTS